MFFLDTKNIMKIVSFFFNFIKSKVISGHIPKEFLKYIIPAYQEYIGIKKNYNKWLI